MSRRAPGWSSSNASSASPPAALTRSSRVASAASSPGTAGGASRSSRERPSVMAALLPHQPAQRYRQGLGQAARPAGSVDQSKSDFGSEQHCIAALNRLGKLEARAAELDHPRHDFEQVVDPGRLEEIAGHPPHRKGQARAAKLAMGDAEKAQQIGAAALAKFEIVGVI